MCGIWAFFGDMPLEKMQEYFQRIQHRGPDNSKFMTVLNNLHFGFHRLAINGLEHDSDQPIKHNEYILICNGEIYNHKELEQKYGFKPKTHSDCEVIIHLYEKFGIKKTCQKLDGVFAFVIYDPYKKLVYAARDRYGVRQMFLSYNDEHTEFGICSEAKGLLFHNNIQQVMPGSWWCSNSKLFNQYFFLEYPMKSYTEEEILPLIREKFTRAIEKRTMSDRKIGALLSGGLDSSIITGLLAKFYDNPKDLETFSIGLSGSPDLFNAQKVANHLGTTHHSVELSEEVFLASIENVIYVLGTFDITTIRASVGHWLICQYIRDHSEVKVIYSGEYADEQNLSYLYGMRAPSPMEFQNESIRLLNYIGYFDNLRGDHCISNAGLEARIPFADKDFMEFMMSLNPTLKMFDNKNRMEKYLIRKAFDGMDIIPQDVLWRRKNGFSDSVSDKERSWSVILQEYIDTQVTDEEFKEEKGKFKHCPPETKEAYYYRKIYQKYYPSEGYDLTPFQWLPKWCGDIKDPSARMLDIYEAD